MKSYTPLFLSILISALVLGFIFIGFYYFTFMGVETVSENAENITISEEYIGDEQDSMNFLLFGVSQRNEGVDFVQLFHFDAQSLEVYSVAIDLSELVTVNVKTMTVAEHYDYGGTQSLVDAVENLFLINIQRYIRVDFDALVELTDFFGGMQYTFPYELQTENNYFEKETVAIDGYRSAEILLQGDLIINSDFMTDVVNNYFDEELLSYLESYYELFFDKVDTDFSKIDFLGVSTPIKLFLQKNEIKCFYLDYYSPEDINQITALF